MKNLKLLDCTLREAPLDNLLWGDLSIRKIIGGLEKAGIDIIEVGFLKNEPYQSGSTSFQRVEEIAPYLAGRNDNTMYVALVDYGRYDLNYLSDCDGSSIDAIRVCFKHNEINSVLAYASEIQKKGYKVCIQHVDTIGYSDREIIEFIDEVNEFKPFAYSIVDTFGAMYSEDALHYMKLAAERLDESIWLGFHAHNNLMLADANAQLFVEHYLNNRNIIVDTSLFGCGRSAGNAHTELIVQYMNQKQCAHYNIDEILDLIDTVIVAAQEKASWGYSIPYFISGMYNAHTFNVKQLLKRHNLRSKDLRGIMEMLDESQKKQYDFALLEKLYVEYFDKRVNDETTIKKLSKDFWGKVILLLGPGISVQKEQAKIQEFIEKENPVVIGVNNLIDGYKQDYVFYSGSIRYYSLQYQDYKLAGSPNIILTSNIKTKADVDEIIVNYSSLIKFGWINIDSSIILLLRLLQRCRVNEMYAAGLDGYQSFGKAFYKNELETNLDEQTRKDHTNDNISMMKDMRETNPNFLIHFLTDSVYKEVFE